jgi:hypothetical protein
MKVNSTKASLKGKGRLRTLSLLEVQVRAISFARAPFLRGE